MVAKKTTAVEILTKEMVKKPMAQTMGKVDLEITAIGSLAMKKVDLTTVSFGFVAIYVEG